MQDFGFYHRNHYIKSPFYFLTVVFQRMHVFGSHTYSLINKDVVRILVKWHFRTEQGIKNIHPKVATEINAINSDSAQEDLFNAIELGEYSRW